MARQNNITFTLYALQNAGVGTLDREHDFEAARELITQSNLPDPTKGGLFIAPTFVIFANSNFSME